MKTIICVERLEPFKETQKVILGFFDAHGFFPISKLIIIGDGSNRKELEKLSEQLDISKLVFFMGKKTEKECLEEIKKADLFITLSPYESQGLALLMAIDNQKPCIVQECDWTKEYEKYGVITANGLDDTGEKILLALREPEMFSTKRIKSEKEEKIKELFEKEKRRLNEIGN